MRSAIPFCSALSSCNELSGRASTLYGKNSNNNTLKLPVDLLWKYFLFCNALLQCLSLSYSHTHTHICMHTTQHTHTAVSGNHQGRCPLTPHSTVLMWVGERGSRNVSLSFFLLLLLLFFLEVDLTDPSWMLPCGVSLYSPSKWAKIH